MTPILITALSTSQGEDKNYKNNTIKSSNKTNIYMTLNMPRVLLWLSDMWPNVRDSDFKTGRIFLWTWSFSGHAEMSQRCWAALFVQGLPPQWTNLQVKTQALSSDGLFWSSPLQTTWGLQRETVTDTRSRNLECLFLWSTSHHGGPPLLTAWAYWPEILPMMVSGQRQNPPPILCQGFLSLPKNRHKDTGPSITASVSCLQGCIANTSTPAVPDTSAPCSLSTAQTWLCYSASQCGRITEKCLSHSLDKETWLPCASLSFWKNQSGRWAKGSSLIRDHLSCTSSPQADSFPQQSLLTFSHWCSFFMTFVIVACYPCYFYSMVFFKSGRLLT